MSLLTSGDGSLYISYIYSTVFVTAVFPASSEAIENVLSDKCVSVCVTWS